MRLLNTVETVKLQCMFPKSSCFTTFYSVLPEHEQLKHVETETFPPAFFVSQR